jgi:transcriptional regulator with XRE-family HTH domain
LAPAVGLSRASVANVEKGRQAVALHVLVKFSEALGVLVGDLIPSDRDVSASPEIRQRLSVLSSTERAWAETVLGSQLMED